MGGAFTLFLEDDARCGSKPGRWLCRVFFTKERINQILKEPARRGSHISVSFFFDGPTEKYAGPVETLDNVGCWYFCLFLFQCFFHAGSLNPNVPVSYAPLGLIWELQGRGFLLGRRRHGLGRRVGRPRRAVYLFPPHRRSAWRRAVASGCPQAPLRHLAPLWLPSRPAGNTKHEIVQIATKYTREARNCTNGHPLVTSSAHREHTEGHAAHFPPDLKTWRSTPALQRNTAKSFQSFARLSLWLCSLLWGEY
jgi:hypothetical protein